MQIFHDMNCLETFSFVWDRHLHQSQHQLNKNNNGSNNNNDIEVTK